MKKVRSHGASASIIHLLHRAGQQAEEMFSKSLGSSDITARQYIVLAIVADSDEPSQTTICEQSGIDRSTLADIVRRLVSRGLLSRRRTRQDARMYAVRLTEQGRQALEKAARAAREADVALVKPLTASQRQEFEAGLHRIIGTGHMTKAAA